MSTRVRAVEYFHVTIKTRPGEAYRLLSQLAAADVNLLAFNAIPVGPEVTQLVLFPDTTEGLTAFAEKAALVLTGPQRWTPKFGQLAKVGSRPRKRSLACHGRDGVILLN